jgi:hypothetical protein
MTANKTLKIEPLHDLEFPLLVTHPKELKAEMSTHKIIESRDSIHYSMIHH